MAGPYTTPKFADTLLPDLFMLVALQNPRRPFVQIIRQHADAPTDSIHFTWLEVIQHAEASAADLRDRWAESLNDDSAKEQTAQRREPGSPPVVVGVLGNNGYELYINVLACLLNRWTALLISPRNSPAAIEHLLRISDSSLFLVEHTNLSFGCMMEQAIPGLIFHRLATLDQAAAAPNSSSVIPFTQEQLKKEMELPAFYMHTSGSTGHPKIVPWSHEFVLSAARSRQRDSGDWMGRPYYCMPPIIHAIGAIAYFVHALVDGNMITFVMSLTPKPPSATSLLSFLPFIEGGIVMLAPSILEDLYSVGPEAVRKVAKGTTSIVTGGAPLNAVAGNALVAAGMKLSTGWGTTEINVGTKQVSTKRPENWEYVYFREGYHWHFLPIDNHSNLRELIVGPGTDGCPAVINHENPRGYATNDVWEPHPTEPNLWRHHSRKGDVTVLSNGEKTDNKQIEGILLGDKRILHVQVFGAGRPINGVVIQPADISMSTSDFLGQIRPTIEHANSILPRHSRLVPELLIVTTPDRPVATTDKGTVKRKETLERFEQEIESAYDALDKGGIGVDWAFEGSATDKDNLKKFVRSAVQTVIGKEVPDAGDLFEYGFDSLLAIRLRMAVVSVVNKNPTAQPVPRNIVYIFPSINALTMYLFSSATPYTNFKGERDERIRQSIDKFSENVVPHIPGSQEVSGKVVALTGSTGSVGSLMVGLLLDREDVEKVYLLNRKGNEDQDIRQKRALKERGLDPKILDIGKASIIYLDIDFSRKDLGLSNKEYAELRDNATHIIHAAWHLNFNLILESYERVHIAGVRYLINLALSSPHAQPPRFTFLSTIAAAAMYRGPTQEPSIGERAGQVLVPEDPIDDPGIAMDQGYGQSKYVSERMLVNAVKAGLRATIIRIGQMSGVTTNGAWATTEHVPIMLRSSLTMGMVPDDLPPVRWIPSDIAASAIVKQAFEDSSPLNYFSVENPFTTQWETVSQVLSTVSHKPLRFVTLAAWLEHIRKSNPDPKEVPATKLLDFYDHHAQAGETAAALAWEKSIQFTPELTVGPITNELVTKYVLYQVEKAREL